MSMFDKINTVAADKAALYSSNSTGAAQAGEGDFICVLDSTEIASNRAKTGQRIRLTYRVVDVLEGDPGDTGRSINEYISDSSKDEILQKKAAILLNEFLAAGINPAKLQDEDDATYWDALVTMVNYGTKWLKKEENTDKVRARIHRVETDKTTENGKPYYNNYFNDDKIDEVDVDDAAEKKETKKGEPQSPFKKKDPSLSD